MVVHDGGLKRRGLQKVGGGLIWELGVGSWELRLEEPNKGGEGLLVFCMVWADGTISNVYGGPLA